MSRKQGRKGGGLWSGVVWVGDGLILLSLDCFCDRRCSDSSVGREEERRGVHVLLTLQ